MYFLMMAALLVFPGSFLNEVLDLSANDISCHKFGTYQTEVDTPNTIVDFSNAEGYDFLESVPAVKVGPALAYNIKLTIPGAQMGYYMKDGCYYMRLGEVNFIPEQEQVFEHGGLKTCVVSGRYERTHLNEYAEAYDAYLMRTTGKGLDMEGRFVFTFYRDNDLWHLKGE